MNSGQPFSELSAAEQAALLYSVGHWTQKELLSRYNVSRSQFSRARDELTAKGILHPNGTATQVVLDLIPVWAWVEIKGELEAQIAQSRSTESELRLESLQRRDEILRLQNQIRGYQEANLDLGRKLGDSQTIIDLLDKLRSMKINVHWVRAAAALTLVEAAMKQKLELLGVHVKEGISFGELRNAIEQALQEKEGRSLRARLLGLNALATMRNKIVHTGHLFVELPKEEADAVVRSVADLLKELAL